MKLKEFRKRKNLSQEAFAKSIGYTLSMVAKVETGKTKASRNFIDKTKMAYPDLNINEVFFT
jgi:transcriptional regulator with XRE-family HTH domain|nr:MAG TPA: Helix-turn-helix XRE-family like protein [Siphoviridae sp. ctIwT7]